MFAGRFAGSLANEPADGIKIFVGNLFFGRDDGVVGDVNVLRTDFGAAFGDVAEAYTGGIAGKRDTVERVFRVIDVVGEAGEIAGAEEGTFLMVVAEDVTDVLTEEAFDASAVFEEALDVLLEHLPRLAGEVFGRRGKGGNMAVDVVVDGDVGDEIFDEGKRAERMDMDILTLELIDPGFAHEPGMAVDFGGTGAAFGGFTVPAAGEVAGQVRLDVVNGVQNNHAFGDWDCVGLFGATRGITAKDVESDVSHGVRSLPGALRAHAGGVGWVALRQPLLHRSCT